MTEKNEHYELKSLAKIMLVNMGFRLDEIHEEYRVDVNAISKSKYFLVDVCGIPFSSAVENKYSIMHKSIAIECGNTSSDKIVNLNLFFDEVYHLPYGVKHIGTFEKNYDETIKTITNLREELKQANIKIYKLESEIRQLSAELEKLNKIESYIKVLSQFIETRNYEKQTTQQTEEKLLKIKF